MGAADARSGTSVSRALWSGPVDAGRGQAARSTAPAPLVDSFTTRRGRCHSRLTSVTDEISEPRLNSLGTGPQTAKRLGSSTLLAAEKQPNAQTKLSY